MLRARFAHQARSRTAENSCSILLAEGKIPGKSPETTMAALFVIERQPLRIPSRGTREKWRTTDSCCLYVLYVESYLKTHQARSSNVSLALAPREINRGRIILSTQAAGLHLFARQSVSSVPLAGQKHINLGCLFCTPAPSLLIVPMKPEWILIHFKCRLSVLTAHLERHRGLMICPSPFGTFEACPDALGQRHIFLTCSSLSAGHVNWA